MVRNLLSRLALPYPKSLRSTTVSWWRSMRSLISTARQWRWRLIAMHVLKAQLPARIIISRQFLISGLRKEERKLTRTVFARISRIWCNCWKADMISDTTRWWNMWNICRRTRDGMATNLWIRECRSAWRWRCSWLISGWASRMYVIFWSQIISKIIIR